MKNPSSLYRATASAPTSVRSRSLVPGPSASKGALSPWRIPVTALPRRTAAVPGGISPRIVSQNSSYRCTSPPKARRTTLSRISDSLRPARTVSSAASCSAIGFLRSYDHCSNRSAAWPDLRHGMRTPCRRRLQEMSASPPPRYNWGFGVSLMRTPSIAGAGLAALVAAGTASAVTAPEAKLQSPLLAPWSGPYGGVPPFEKVKVEDFKPALETGMAEALAEID